MPSNIAKLTLRGLQIQLSQDTVYIKPQELLQNSLPYHESFGFVEKNVFHRFQPSYLSMPGKFPKDIFK